MEITIEKTELFLNHVRTRLPFKYGIATLTEAPQVFIRVHIRAGENVATGIASDILPPKWFTKVPEKAIEDEIQEMLAVIRKACELAADLKGNSIFSLWLKLYQAQKNWGATVDIPPLLSNFGVTLIERAIIEAWCKLHATTFHAALLNNSLGIELGAIHCQLKDRIPSGLLPATPLPYIYCRHTVGLGDALLESDVVDKPPDHLPCSLETAIQHYGLLHFKVKINGNIATDIARMRKLAPILQPCGPQLCLSLDGNEQYKNAEDLREFWHGLTTDPSCKWLARHIVFIEQPFHRDTALSEEVGQQISSWENRPSLIIDESDAELPSYPLALSLGYDGTSHKNCKGIFKGIANRCLTAFVQPTRARKTLMSGEDLGNIGPVSLPQDIAVMAALGIESVERNGHHYFPGLSMFSENLQNQITEHHPDLYSRQPNSWAALQIKSGKINAETINRSPFGLRFDPDLESYFQRLT